MLYRDEGHGQRCHGVVTDGRDGPRSPRFPFLLSRWLAVSPALTAAPPTSRNPHAHSLLSLPLTYAVGSSSVGQGLCRTPTRLSRSPTLQLRRKRELYPDPQVYSISLSRPTKLSNIRIEPAHNAKRSNVYPILNNQILPAAAE